MTKDEALVLLMDAPVDDQWSKLNMLLTRKQAVNIVLRGIMSLPDGPIPDIFEKRVYQVCNDRP